jgi:hypothetical protein
MGSAKRASIAADVDFQARVEMVLYYNAADILSAEEGTYGDNAIATAKKVVNGLIPIANFCKLLVMEDTFGPLVDAAANVDALTDGQINTAVPIMIVVLNKAAI